VSKLGHYLPLPEPVRIVILAGKCRNLAKVGSMWKLVRIGAPADFNTAMQ